MSSYRESGDLLCVKYYTPKEKRCAACTGTLAVADDYSFAAAFIFGAASVGCRIFCGRMRLRSGFSDEILMRFPVLCEIRFRGLYAVILPAQICRAPATMAVCEDMPLPSTKRKTLWTGGVPAKPLQFADFSLGPQRRSCGRSVPHSLLLMKKRC